MMFVRTFLFLLLVNQFAGLPATAQERSFDFVPLEARCMEMANGSQSTWFHCLKLEWETTFKAAVYERAMGLFPQNYPTWEYDLGVRFDAYDYTAAVADGIFHYAFNKCVRAQQAKQRSFAACMQASWSWMVDYWAKQMMERNQAELDQVINIEKHQFNTYKNIGDTGYPYCTEVLGQRLSDHAARKAIDPKYGLPPLREYAQLGRDLPAHPVEEEGQAQPAQGCFLEDTPVQKLIAGSTGSMTKNYVSIDEVEVNDFVLSSTAHIAQGTLTKYAPGIWKHQKLCWAKVLKVHQGRIFDGEYYLGIRFYGDENEKQTVNVTPHHHIYADPNWQVSRYSWEWIRADSLPTGNQAGLFVVNDSHTAVREIIKEEVDQPGAWFWKSDVFVYDLSIKDTQAYVVGHKGNEFLAHNIVGKD